MNREGFLLRITSYQRIGSQGFDGLIEPQGIFCYRGKPQPNQRKLHCMCCQDLFRDVIRREKCAKVQQLGGCWILLFNTLKGERPGSSNRVWMIGHQSSTLL